MQTLPYVCEAYAAEPLYKGIVRGTVMDTFTGRAEPCPYAKTLENARLGGTVMDTFTGGAEPRPYAKRWKMRVSRNDTRTFAGGVEPRPYYL